MQIAFLIGLIVFGLSFAYVTYLLQPQLASIKNKQSEITSKQEEYTQLSTYSANPYMLNKEIQTQEVELARIAKTLPSTLDKPVLVYNIYTTLKRHNLVSESLSFDKLETKELYSVIGLSFSALGSSKDIMDMINELQNSSDALVLRSVSFKAQDTGLKADLKLQAFARLGAKELKLKPHFMSVAFGIDSIPKLFSPAADAKATQKSILTIIPPTTVTPNPNKE